MEAPFWFVGCKAAGHWLSTVLLRVLWAPLSETADDLLVTAVMVLSQVDFATFGFAAFNEATEIAERRDSFKCVGMLEYISNSAVLDRLTFTASERPECFLTEVGENAEAEVQDKIGARLKVIDEGETLKSAILYLSKVGADLVRVVEALKE